MADNVSAAPSRPKLNLKPRDPSAAAKLETERQQSLGSSPFGAAKPREVVIAQRVGKSEEEILKEEVKREKLHLRLSGAQLDEKRAVEASLKDLEEQIALEEDAEKKVALQAELAERQGKLDELMEMFAKATLETALSGEAPRVSALRRLQAEQAVAPPPPQQFAAGHYNPRYNPTQQYAGAAQRGGYAPRGGHDDQMAAMQRTGSSGYVPRSRGTQDGGGGYQRGGGAGGGRGVPEWAREEYSQPGGGSGGGGFGTAGGYRVAGDGYDNASDAGFYDQPPAGAAYGGGDGGGRSRGRGRGRAGRDGYSSGVGGYAAAVPGGYAPGRGVGGEIEFDAFGGQDRY